MNEYKLKESIEEFRVSQNVKDANLSTGRIDEYIRRALDQALSTAVATLPEKQGQEFLLKYYTSAIETLAAYRTYKGILKESPSGTWQPLQ